MNKDQDISKKKAVAIKYTEDMKAPKVVAKGKGYVAEKIIENAQNSNITVYENKELVEELSKIDLGLEIPPHLYEIVAQILVFISDLEKKEQYKNYGK